MQFLIDITLTLFYLLGFLLLCAWGWRFWKMYINQKFLNQYGKDCILLEIKLPRDIFKSPKAMEVALSAFLQGGGVGSWYDRNVKGQLLNYFSLEIASLEGVIHFYVRTHKKFKSLIEVNLYAQYPGIEITEADDYTARIRYHHLSNDVGLWGATYSLTQKWSPRNSAGKLYDKSGSEVDDPKIAYKMSADYLPIKTYVDYELDKDPKEEFKTDPIVPLIEFMGSLGKGEYLWYQIMVQDDSKHNDIILPKTYLNDVTHEHMSLSDMASARKKQLRTASVINPGDPVFDDYGNPRMIPSGEKDADGKDILQPAVYNFSSPKVSPKSEVALTTEEKDEIELINRKLSKPVVCAVVRLVYVTKSESQRFAQVIPGILTIMRHFGNSSGNGFAPSPADKYEYPWENTMGRRVPWRSEELFEAYVEREGFYPHVGERAALDKWEDLFFWTNSMETRKKWRMLYEAVRHPFDHPHPEVICLNLEELATLWHFPGAVASTPFLARVDSNKGVPPLNLPQ